MKVQEIREMARRFGIAGTGMKKADLIRSIQHAEGNEACFDSGRSQQCGQQGCAWRQDCK